MTTFTNSALLRSIGRNIFNVLEIADNDSVRVLLREMIEELNQGKLNMIVPKRDANNHQCEKLAPRSKIILVKGAFQQTDLPPTHLQFLHTQLRPLEGDIICLGINDETKEKRNKFDVPFQVCVALEHQCVLLERTSEYTFLPRSLICLDLNNFRFPRHWYEISPPDQIRLPFTLFVWASLTSYHQELKDNLTFGLLPTDAYEACYCPIHCGCEEFCFCDAKGECHLNCWYTRVQIFAQYFYFVYDGDEGKEEALQLLSYNKLFCSIFALNKKRKIKPKSNTLFFSKMEIDTQRDQMRKQFEK